VIKLSDFVNADESGSSDEGDEETPVCSSTFGEAVASVEFTRRYFCSHKTDYASLSRTGT
jgi:hypothetical protein